MRLRVLEGSPVGNHAGFFIAYEGGPFTFLLRRKSSFHTSFGHEILCLGTSV